MLRCPVFHVNGEDPEAVAQVVELAIEFRAALRRDVVIDMYCYRRYGHNEADEPRFTQPLMYAAIDKKPTVREVYVKHLVERGNITRGAGRGDRGSARRRVLEAGARGDARRALRAAELLDAGPVGAATSAAPTQPRRRSTPRVPRRAAARAARRSVTEVPRRLQRAPEGRAPARDCGARWPTASSPLDWGTAEPLAFASLVDRALRACGSPARTRAAAPSATATRCCTTTQTGKLLHAAARISTDQGRFEVCDSPLSEAGVLGFEYGYSLDSPDALVIWEAQFGDFCNGAQVIIDQFLVAARRTSGTG